MPSKEPKRFKLVIAIFAIFVLLIVLMSAERAIRGRMLEDEILQGSIVK